MISCRCITYGRVEYLEELLHSFLIQEYSGERELVIVNDYPLQRLIYEHPLIKIINLDKTFDVLGDKENFAVEQCKGETIAVFDDDDLCLPNHLSNIDKYFTEGTDLLHWKNGIFMNLPDITALTSVGNSGIVYSKRIWKEIGGYPQENAGYDMTFVNKIKSVSKNIVYANPPDDEVSWIYVWAGRGYHCSGMGTDTPDRPNVIKRHSDYVEGLRKQGKIPTGDIILHPHWKKDYCKMLKNFIKK